jgi:hypothetical protein
MLTWAAPMILVLTDSEGRVLASARADPVEIAGETIQIVAIGTDRRAAPGTAALVEERPSVEAQSHEIEVSEDLLGGPVEDLHAALERRVRSGPAPQS